MSKEFKFKEALSEMSFEEAEKGKEDIDFKKKLKDIKSSLSNALINVKSDSDFAYVVLAIKDMLPGITNDEAKAGLKLALQTFGTSPAVSKDAPGAMYDKMPLPKGMEVPKNESFARMQKLANLKD